MVHDVFDVISVLPILQFLCHMIFMAASSSSNSLITPFKQPISFPPKFSILLLKFRNLNVSVSCRISCRYGGGINSRLEDSRRSQQTRNSDYDDGDQPLDVFAIRSNTVRLIDDEQNMVGIVSKTTAIQMAQDAQLDLVILSPDADPPVVKLMDYGYNIDVHDYYVRLRAAHKFLRDGDKVKVIVNLKGRENEFRNKAIELMKRFHNDIGELGIEESKNLKDKNIFMVLIPNKAVVQKESPMKKGKSKSTKTELSAII